MFKLICGIFYPVWCTKREKAQNTMQLNPFLMPNTRNRYNAKRLLFRTCSCKCLASVWNPLACQLIHIFGRILYLLGSGEGTESEKEKRDQGSTLKIWNSASSVTVALLEALSPFLPPLLCPLFFKKTYIHRDYMYMYNGSTLDFKLRFCLISTNRANSK